ncbi:unnamed protein product [Bursaphelenchus okinawaensis]|uniref:Fukutin n=1 Tax=Bursaphelenchus okinawaensis TaxID=465554 RepID=A0A811L5L9_9BILA|nr:unnamed protein product [Bursaphelenchus okinawaensis]CAG9117142.1 unnamed protein product [Bursaphelenchus okinawaensis]
MRYQQRLALMAPRNTRSYLATVLKIGPLGFALLCVYAVTQSHLHQKAEKRHIEKVENCLLVDVDCLENLAQQKPCKGPIKCAMSGPATSKHIKTEYIMEDDPSKTYITLHGAQISKNGTMAKRVLPRFKTSVPFITVPVDDSTYLIVKRPKSLKWLNFHWPKSQFMECMNFSIVRDVTRIIPLTKVGVFDEIRRRGDKQNVTVFLIGGSLLGWYRECDIIEHTHDLDFAIQYKEYRTEFFKHLDSVYRRRFRAGRIEEGLETSYHVWGNVRADFFIMYQKNKTTEYIAGMMPWKRQVIRYYSPRITKMCSGDLHGQLVYVPCNTEAILESTYGKQWYKDVPTNSYNYAESSSNTEMGEVFSEAQWLSVWNEFNDKDEPTTEKPEGSIDENE